MQLSVDLLVRTTILPGRVQYLLQDWSLLKTKPSVFSHSAITLSVHAFSPLKLFSARQIIILRIIIMFCILSPIIHFFINLSSLGRQASPTYFAIVNSLYRIHFYLQTVAITQSFEIPCLDLYLR